MQYEHLRGVDLNLLVAFSALMEERSVTGAARRMFVSQPAMSRMFDRLQVMLNDELLIRTPKGYEPTHRASSIYQELQATLPKLQAVLSKSDFDVSRASGVFRIESTDWGATVLIPELVRATARHAPGMQIDVLPRQSGYDSLESNEADLILGGLLPRGTDNGLLKAEALLRDRIVCLVRKGHPLAQGKLAIREYVRARHISLSVMASPRRLPLAFSFERQPGVAQALERLGAKPDVRVRVPYFVSLGVIVAKSDLVATLPLHIARRVKSPRTCIIAAPPEFQGVSFHQIWHSRNESSPMHQWVRGMMRQIAASITKRRETAL